MIHIGTLHYRDGRWIEIQLRYLERHTGEPYRVYASLDGIDERYRAAFDHVIDDGRIQTAHGRGAAIEEKLRILAEEMVARASAEDLLVFVHGDTLPITGWVAPVREMIAESSLAAIRRPENMEPIPHWSFCATTAGFWTEIGGDWARGPTWEFLGDPVTDTGGALWKNLEQRGVAWHQILRSNRVNPHPLWFGVYGDLVYHHGAGFRTPMSRMDAAGYLNLPIAIRNLAGVRKRIANTLLARRMFARIHEDERFYRELIGAPER